MLTVFKLLARLKGLRGSAIDIFGWTAERKTERRLRDEYIADIEKLCADLSPENYAISVELAEVPEQIRGFGHIKQTAITDAEVGRRAILEKLGGIKRQERAA